MCPYAQTNLQLFAQLHDLGCSDDDLCRSDRGYRLLMRLFSAQFRSNGKPFLAHLVGTASILAAHGASIDTVLAGLAHAAYAFGEFGGADRTVDARKRQMVRQAIGAGAEEIVAEYTAVQWGRGQELTAAFSSQSPLRREAMRVRVANELEESLDQGLQYGPAEQHGFARKNLADCRAFAELLGLTALGNEIAEALHLLESSSVPACLVRPETFSFTLHSLTVRQRLQAALKYKLIGFARRLHLIGKRSEIA